MEFEKFQNDVSDWILNWVSQHNEKLKKIPCPFARNALMSKKIDWATAPDLKSLESLLRLLAMNGLHNEVLIVGMHRNSITSAQLSSLIKDINKTELMPKNIVALEDHPDDHEVINGEKMNQGEWVLILIQELDKINQASKILEKQGYYADWSQEAYDDVVSWRFNQAT